MSNRDSRWRENGYRPPRRYWPLFSARLEPSRRQYPRLSDDDPVLLQEQKTDQGQVGGKLDSRGG